MIDDDKAPSAAQQHQMAAGQYMALSAAVHALIATHPNRAAFLQALDEYAATTAELLLHREALRQDDGLRQSYAEILRSIRGAAANG